LFTPKAIAVDDLDAALEHLQCHNVDLPGNVVETPARYVILPDPAGNPIELVEFYYR
jgi:hypothetical protein